MSDEQRSADAALLALFPLFLQGWTFPFSPFFHSPLLSPHYSFALLPPLILSYSSDHLPLASLRLLLLLSALHPLLVFFFTPQWSVLQSAQIPW